MSPICLGELLKQRFRLVTWREMPLELMVRSNHQQMHAYCLQAKTTASSGAKHGAFKPSSGPRSTANPSPLRMTLRLQR